MEGFNGGKLSTDNLIKIQCAPSGGPAEGASKQSSNASLVHEPGVLQDESAGRVYELYRFRSLGIASEM